MLESSAVSCSPSDNWDSDVAAVLSRFEGGSAPGTDQRLARPGLGRGRSLFQCQTSPQPVVAPPTVTMGRGGSLIKVKIPDGRQVNPNRRQRGRVKGFTASSRKRFFDGIHLIDSEMLARKHCIFVTLTYHLLLVDPHQAKRHLDSIVKRFERQFGPHGGWWKLEPQRRGAPHFHLVMMIDSLQTLEQMPRWWAENWHEIAGDGSADHLAFHRGELGNQHCVQNVKTVDQLMRYLGKYMGKIVEQVEGWDWPGRFWGVIRRAIVSTLARPLTCTVPFRLAILLRRSIIRYIEHQPISRYRIQLSPTCVDRRHVSKEELPDLLSLAELGHLRVRAYHRRSRRRSSGGITGYIPAADYMRLFNFCCRSLGLKTPLQILTELERYKHGIATKDNDLCN